MQLDLTSNSVQLRITPRLFQVSARDALRSGFIEGHRCQMVMIPTGSGKTNLGMFLINEALTRGKRAIFVADRRTLTNQTSLVAESLGLPHGVPMADSTRYDPDCAFQIASAHTLAIRQLPKSASSSLMKMMAIYALVTGRFRPIADVPRLYFSWAVGYFLASVLLRR